MSTSINLFEQSPSDLTPHIRDLKFTEEGHRYDDERGKTYTSVTTLIEKPFPKFDRMYWATIKARERGISPKQILDEWDKITADSHVRGNEKHNFIENAINATTDNRMVRVHQLGLNFGKETTLEEFIDNPIKDRMPSIYNAIMSILKAGYKMFAEKQVYWAEFGIAGTIDLLFVRDDGTFVILDWKTNKDRLMFESGYFRKDKKGNRFGQWVRKLEYANDPIPYIEKCKGNKYTLQLSMYAYLCELWGLKCRRLGLYHIREGYPLTTESGFHVALDPYYPGHELTLNVDFHEIKYMKDACSRIIDAHVNNQFN